MTVPFAALKAFVDPSVKFGLQFSANDLAQGSEFNTNVQENEQDPSDKIKSDNIPATANIKEADNDSDENTIKKSAEIVSIETFRKK